MPPLTLEQVLARSMRLPQSRAKRASGSLFSPVKGLTPAAASATSRRNAHALSFMNMLEKEEGERAAGRLSIHPSDNLVRNSADLLTFLQAARRMQAWEEALRAFAAATGSPAAQVNLVDDSTARGSSGAAVVDPSAEHVVALLDTLAAARQWAPLLSLAQYYGVQLPDVLPRAVAALMARGRRTADDGPAAAGKDTAAAMAAGRRAFEAAPPLVEAVRALAGPAPIPSAPAPAGVPPLTTYEVALLFLQLCSVRPADIPVACFNAVLAGCEEAKDWRTALRVVRAMGPNPLQGWTALGEEESRTEAAGGGTSSEVAPASATSPPSPDVVSYATLLATLEQAGKDTVAAQVLSRLPALEKEEITASYAALIFVWSNQVLHNKNRRRR